MKKIFLLVVLVLYTLTIFCQSVPQAFTYQAIARDDAGMPLANQKVSLNIAILEATPSGKVVYTETFDNISTNKFGLFSLEIGKGNSGDDFEEIGWANNSHFIKTEMDSGKGFNLSGTLPILSVPYAIVAQKAIEDAVEDADADPNNEIQSLSFDPTSSELIISDGNSVIIPTGGTDADADPQNEIQNLSFDPASSELTISKGNSITIPTGGTDADADPQNEIQNLSFDPASSELTISEGNTVTLPRGGADADADPQNEIQQINLTGNTISLSNGGGSIDLPASSNTSLWKEGDEYIFYPNQTGEEIVKVQEEISSIIQQGFNGRGAGLDIFTSAGKNGVELFTVGDYLDDGNSNTADNFTTMNFYVDGKELLGISASGGGISPSDDALLLLAAEEGNSGRIHLYTPDGGENALFPTGIFMRDKEENRKINLFIGSTTGNTILTLYGQNEEIKTQLFGAEDAGVLVLNGSNSSSNCLGTRLSGFSNNGYFAVLGDNGLDADNIPDAGMLVDEDGNGKVSVKGTYGFSNTETTASMYIDEEDGAVITGDLKSFKMPHPTKKDKEIRYACIEGPEAAAYERGTARLENGEAFIPFSDHFSIVINPATMTVNLTPMSANTLGLAVIEKTAAGIRVKELMDGKGNFQFDWEVKAVRKGYEDFKVVRDKLLLDKIELPELETQKQ